MSVRRRVGLVGARGHVGSELVRLLSEHEGFELAWMTSARETGKPVRSSLPHAPEGLSFEAPEPERLAGTGVDLVFLGLPNGESDPWVQAFDVAAPKTILIDISSDHRGAQGWVYGNPERLRHEIVHSARIANPGCYATAMLLSLGPLVPFLEGPAHAFGVSGYSGAGSTPSPRNDPEVLRDNIVPYHVVDHAHGLEVSRELGCQVHFSPHVASFFRGLVVTASFVMREATTTRDLQQIFREAYKGEPFITLSDIPPHPRDSVGRHDVRIGGFAMSQDRKRGAMVATLDNLLAGAASQALRNANLATGQLEGKGLSS